MFLGIVCFVSMIASLSGCGEGEPATQSKKGDLESFILSEITRFHGLKKSPPKNPPTRETAFEYVREETGMQLLCKGDRVVELEKVLSAHFGSPAISTNNESGPYFTYSISQIGVALICGLEKRDRNEVYTHLAITEADALRKSMQAK